jgi:hypothetical protein
MICKGSFHAETPHKMVPTTERAQEESSYVHAPTRVGCFILSDLVLVCEIMMCKNMFHAETHRIMVLPIQ